MGDLETSFAGDLLIVSRHLPLDLIHPNARPAAIASEAAARQGMFEEMADQLFANQAQWAGVGDPTSLFESYAIDIGLDLGQFRTDVADPALNARVTRDATEASGLGLAGTPSFFLQGSKIANPPSAAAFEQVIHDAIDALDEPFTINRQTGEIILRDASLLDSVDRPVIILPVIVSDFAGNVEIVEITINVTL